MLSLGLALALLGPPACPDVPSDLATLVPEGATIVAGVDVDAFAKTAVGRATLPALRGDLQLAETLEVLDDCGVQLERTYAAVVARDGGDGRLAIIQGRGLGEAATLTCLAAELEARSDGATAWTRRERGCVDTLELGGALGGPGARAWVANQFTLVWASGPFVEPVEDVLLGEVPPTLPANLATELGRVDRDAHAWLAARLGEDERAALPWAWARETTALTVAIDLSDGLALLATFAAPDVAGLASLQQRVVNGILALGERLDEYGVDHQLRERARIGVVDDGGQVVAARLDLQADELRSIQTNVTERLEGRGPL